MQGVTPPPCPVHRDEMRKASTLHPEQQASSIWPVWLIVGNFGTHHLHISAEGTSPNGLSSTSTLSAPPTQVIKTWESARGRHLWRKRESVERLWRPISALVLHRLPAASCYKRQPRAGGLFKRRPGIPLRRWSSSAHQMLETYYSAMWRERDRQPMGEKLRKRELP